ncbi:MAG: hypothetical protein KJZ47_10145 [Gemmatimonadales bacterium]|nr:hypothetical protein [Gemmatimonadales bacterium]
MRAAVFLLLAVGCSRSPEPPPPPEPPPAPPAAPAEELASRPMPGVEIWFMEGRPGRDSTGFECFERTLEIRDSAGRRRVPLLYTLDAPTRLDDSSVRAQVFLHCQPGQAYRVDLRTGRPTPLPQ